MENAVLENKCTNVDLDSYKSTIRQALKVLKKKNLSLIIHGSSFPSLEGENTGFGSPNSAGAKKLVSFVSGMFDSLQLGPAGKTKAIDSSPYTGTIFSNNPLFIELKPLTAKEWGSILSKETFQNIVANNPNAGTNKTAYSYIFQQQEVALREAFETFRTKSIKEVAKLAYEFEKYKEENESWLEKDSLYEALSHKHQNDYWPAWSDELDKNLFNPKSEEEKKAAQKRIKETKKQYEDVIEFYSFCQFVAAKQREEFLKFAKKNDVKLIADRQVAFSDRDYWAYQSFFLEGWNLGCPPDYFSKDGQAWGFPVINPDKLFTKTGALAEGGKLLKALYKKMFKENPGGVRIDHIIGLIDPWVYKTGRKPMVEEGAGRLFSSPEHPELSKFAIATLEDLDPELEADKEYRIKTLTKAQIKKYGALIGKVVIAAAEEEGLSKDEIICEDLGTLTYPVECVMKEYQLKGMRLTQFVVPEKPKHPYRCANIKTNCWAMVGTHDNEPIAMWADALVNTHEAYLHAKNLAEDLLPDERKSEADDFICALTRDTNLLRETKLVELFACKAESVQIFFSDFFGIYDVYNKPGTSGDQNWSLRLHDNFESFYCEQLSKNQGINFAKILKLAIETKGTQTIKKNAALIKKLNEFANIMKK